MPAPDPRAAFDVAGRVVVITGGGRGLGRAMSARLAAAGARVVMAGRTQADLDETVAASTADGGEAVAVRADVGNYDDLPRIVAAAIDRCGGIDVLVDNAAIHHIVPIEQETRGALERILSVNLVGTFIGMQAVLEPMFPGQPAPGRFETHPIARVGEPGEVADAVPVPVGERAWVDLVDDAGLPPRRLNRHDDRGSAGIRDLAVVARASSAMPPPSLSSASSVTSTRPTGDANGHAHSLRTPVTVPAHARHVSDVHRRRRSRRPRYRPRGLREQ